MNGDCSERLPQECECHQDGESGILENSSAFAQRVLEEIEDFAGTTTCKSVQLVRLKKWAQEQGCWFDDRSQFGDFFDRGSENEVYLSPDQKEIIKLNDFRYSDDIFLKIKMVRFVQFWYNPLLLMHALLQKRRFMMNFYALVSTQKIMANIILMDNTISLMPLMVMY